LAIEVQMKTSKKKHILIVNQSAPYSSSNAKESLDIALAAGAFEQSVAILFIGDGCYQLLSNQSPKQTHSKNISQMLKVLPVYGIDKLYVDEQSLSNRNIEQLDENLTLTKVSQHEIQALYKEATTVFRF